MISVGEMFGRGQAMVPTHSPGEALHRITCQRAVKGVISIVIDIVNDRVIQDFSTTLSTPIPLIRVFEVH